LVGGVFAIWVLWFVLSKQIPDFSEGADNASASPAEVPPDQPVQVTEVPNTYLGISLGDSEQQVRYVLGEPLNSTNVGEYVSLFYSTDLQSYKLIVVNKSDGVTLITCYGDCPSLLGVSIGDSEETLRKKLGAPNSEELIEITNAVTKSKAIHKAIRYGTVSVTAFILREKKVIGMTI
jgi:hypothetical protein